MISITATTGRAPESCVVHENLAGHNGVNIQQDFSRIVPWRPTTVRVGNKAEGQKQVLADFLRRGGGRGKGGARKTCLTENATECAAQPVAAV